MFTIQETKRLLAAHWVLTQIFKEQPAYFGQNVLIDANGTLFIERDGIMHEMGESKGRIGYLQGLTNKYSKEQLTDAINLLASNGHVKFEFTENAPYSEVLVVSTANGAIAYRNEYYLNEADDKQERWPKKNWHWFGIITFVIGIVTPILIERLKSELLPHTKTTTTEQIESKKDTASVR